MSDTQKHTKPNVPNLRFPGFSDEWESRKIGEDCAVYMCKRIFANQTSDQGDVPFFKIGTIGGTPDAYISKDLFEEYRAKYNYPRKGEVMITCAGTVGKTIVFDGEDAYFQDSNIVWLSNPKQLYINPFLNYVLSRVNWNKLNSTTITRIYNENLRELVINFPTVKEQEKVVALLSILDKRIAIQNKVIEDLITLEKEIINHVFKTLNTVSQPLSIISERVTARNTNALCNNVLTISARDGLISQLDFFNKSVASHNLSNYILLKKGDFAYNKSYSADHPWGAIKHLEIYEEGVLSPLYFCFRPLKDHIDTEYLQLYFETDLWHKHISDISVEGARNHGLLNMPVGDFMALPVPVPELNIQHDIARSLKSLRNKKSNERKYREFLLRQKTYLLSHLFL